MTYYTYTEAKIEKEIKMSNNWLQNLNLLSEKYVELLDILSNKNFSNNINMPTPNYDLMKQISDAFIDIYCNHPEEIAQNNIEYYQNFSELLTNSMNNFMQVVGEKNKDSSMPKDKRFIDNQWREDIFFNFVKEYYMLSSNWMNKSVKKLNISPQAKHYLEFATQQFLNASSPSNFPFLNPEVIRESTISNGENIIKGMENLIRDLKKSSAFLNISTTDIKAFNIGENIATTEGKVVYQNDMMQLICYKPQNMTYSIPILISPPWINKYYILDLSCQNSFVQWLTQKGFQVFMISWVNPDKKLANKNFEDYLKEGIVDAVNYISKTFGYSKINTIGYCLGGTLLASSLAYLKSQGSNVMGSSTILATLLDFSNSGDMGLFINKESYNIIEKIVDQNGVLDSGYMTNIFNILRSNEMIWSYFVNNYLLGKSPLPFDILYWNSDGTNLPSAMHKFYLKNMYIENNLSKPGGINLLGIPIDLSLINNPMFVLSTKEDHIVPWKSAFKATKLVSGMVEFCLAASGHVAGVVNHPAKNKYSYWVNKNFSKNIDAESWFAESVEKQGSWWNHWLEWQEQFSGEMVKSIEYENIKNFIENAPGSYVKMVAKVMAD